MRRASKVGSMGRCAVVPAPCRVQVRGTARQLKKEIMAMQA